MDNDTLLLLGTHNVKENNVNEQYVEQYVQNHLLILSIPGLDVTRILWIQDK